MRGGMDLETGDLILVGDAEAFGTFSGYLRGAEASTIELEPVRDWPAIRPVRCVRVSRGPEGATIRIDDDAAAIIGNQESLDRLADEIDLFLEHNDLNDPGVHAHLESASSSATVPLLAPESRGLVLAGPVPNSS